MSYQSVITNLVQTIINAPVACLLLLKITAILGVAWLLHRGLSKANPRWRVLLWRMTAVGLFALPVVAFVLPAIKIHFQPPVENSPAVNHTAIPPTTTDININAPPKDIPQYNPVARKEADYPLAPASQPISEEKAAKKAISTPVQQPSNTLLQSALHFLDAKIIFIIIWLSGVVVLAGRFFIGYRRVLQISKSAKQSPEWVQGECKRVAESLGCTSEVAVMQSEETLSPYLCGLKKARLLLPVRMCQVLYRTDLPGIFAHELTHLRNRDLLWNTFLHLISILLWFHPLAWRLRKAHLTSCELVCDAVSAGFVGDVNEYCRTLARVAVAVCETHPAAGIAIAKLSTISHRLNVLKKQVFHLPLQRRNAIGFGIVAMLLIVVLGVMKFAFAEPDLDKLSKDKTITNNKITEKTEASVIEDNGLLPIFLSASGKVQDESGKPVSGATVYLREWSTYRISQNYFDRKPKDILATVKTDSQGKYSFKDTPAKPFKEQWTREIPWDVVVVSRGHAIAWQHLDTPNQVDPISFQLKPETRITGKVTNEKGQPVVGAEVKVNSIEPLVRDKERLQLSEPGYFDLYESQLAPIAKTDANGQVSIGGLPRDVRVSLFIDHENYRTNGVTVITAHQLQSIYDVNVNQNMDDEKVFLENFAAVLEPPLPRIIGRITAADTGKPLSNIKISFGSAGVISDESGRFVIKGVRVSQDRLFLSTSKKSEYLGKIVPVVIPEGNEEVEFTIQLPRGQEVSGHVVSADTGKGVAGVTVSSFTEYGRLVDKIPTGTLFPSRDITDKEGHFCIAVPAEKRKLAIFGPLLGYDIPSGGSSYDINDTRFCKEIDVQLGKPVPEVTFKVSPITPPEEPPLRREPRINTWVFPRMIESGVIDIEAKQDLDERANEISKSSEVTTEGKDKAALADVKADKTPRVEIKLTIIEVPKQSKVASQLPSGGVILSQSETRELIDNAQNDKRANVLQAPRMKTRLGEGAFACTPWGSQTLVCKVIPNSTKYKDSIALQIKPELVEPGKVSTLVTDSDSWHWRSSVNVELKQGEGVALGGWDSTNEEGRRSSLATLVLLQANYVAFANEDKDKLPRTETNVKPAAQEERPAETKKEVPSAKTAKMPVRVVDENGRGIADAKVKAEAGYNKYDFTTDADGRATVEIPESALKNLWIKIHAEGHVPLTWYNQLKGKTLPSENVFTMEPGYTVGGFVQDEQGNPIKDVQVELLQQYNSGYMPLEPYSKTDSEGRWTYSYAPKDLTKINYVLSHTEYMNQGLLHLSAMEHKKIQDLTAVMVMKKGTPVSGTVFDPDDKPIANALVAQGTDRLSSSAGPTTRTDKDGHYRLTLVSPRENVLTVVSPGLAPVLRQIDTQQKKDAIDFHLEKGNTIKLRVVDKDNKPISGVNIVPGTWLGYRTLVAEAGIGGKTDKEGRWAWSWAPKDAVEMSAYKSGYLDIRELPLTPQADEYVIILKRPLTITGKVVDAETKQIIPNFRIVPGYIPEGDNDSRVAYWDRNNVLESNDGQYKVIASFPHKAHFVRIEAEGYTPGISREFKTEEGNVSYDFSLSKGDKLNVKVLSPDGKPAAGADVKLCPVPLGKYYNMAMFIKSGQFLYPESTALSLKVDSDGRLPIAPQETEYLLVIIHDKGFAKTTSQDLKNNPEIKLDAWARLEGVIKHGAKPLPNVKLDVFDNRRYDPQWSFINFQDANETDADGKFFYPKLPPGKWSVRVLPNGKPEINALFQRPQNVELTSGQTTSVTFGDTGRPVIGKIQWPEGKPAEGDLSKIGASLCTKLPEMPTPPKEVSDKGPDAYRQWLANWEKTEKGKAFRKAAQNAGCGVGVPVKADGSFRFEGVTHGKYEISVSLGKVDADSLPWEFPETLRYTADCIVPEVSGGKNYEPVDLGNVLLKDESPKKLPSTLVKVPAPQAPAKKTVGSLSDNYELMRYIIATYTDNLQKIKTWQGKAEIENKSVYYPIKSSIGVKYSATVQFVFDRSKKSLRWDNTLNNYVKQNSGVDDPQPVPQILNGMQTPKGIYRYGRFGSPGNPANGELNLLIYSFPEERINPNQFDFNPLDFLQTFRGNVAKDLTPYTGWADKSRMAIFKIIREGDNVTIDIGNDQSYNRYTLSLSQSCNPISCEDREPGRASQWKWTYEKIDGVWLPKTWSETVRNKDEQDEDQKVTFVENLLNQPVEASAFSLPSLGVKPGNKVQDRRVQPIRHFNYEKEDRLTEQ